MKNLLVILSLFTISLCSVAQSVETYRNPVIGGDHPDPSIIRVNDTYYAVATSNGFGPLYPVYESKDMVNWTRISSVFLDLPSWTVNSFWAPELYYENGTFFVYYTARRKSDKISCIGVATTKDIHTPFTDHGIIIEWGKEAIDAYIFKDDDGKKYISWKAYGLTKGRPIELLCSELSKDGLKLVGEHFSLTQHDKGWKKSGEEGQCMVKRNGYYYVFYSVGGCCDNRCDYRVEVARSKSIKGPYEQYSQNPILEGGGLWKCCGHGTMVQSPEDRWFYLYHSYHTYDFEFIGRQVMLDELCWNDETGWPYFKQGRNPSAQAPVPFKGTVQKSQEQTGNLLDPEVAQYLQWNVHIPKPRYTNDSKGTTLICEEKYNHAFLGTSPLDGNYSIETALSAKSATPKGLCIYGDEKNRLEIVAIGNKIEVVECKKGNENILYSFNSGEYSTLYLRSTAISGRWFRFEWSTDRKTWTRCEDSSKNSEFNGLFLPQWGTTMRSGIIVKQGGDNRGTFDYLSIF